MALICCVDCAKVGCVPDMKQLIWLFTPTVGGPPECNSIGYVISFVDPDIAEDLNCCWDDETDDVSNRVPENSRSEANVVSCDRLFLADDTSKAEVWL